MKLRNKILALTCALGVVFVTGCGPNSTRDYRAYLNFLSDKKYGLVKEKAVAGINYRVKFLPADYLAYTCLRGDDLASQTKKDSLKKVFAGSFSFLVNISPLKEQSESVLNLQAHNYEEFANRLEALAFESTDWFSIERSGTTIKPAIVKLESLNPVDNGRNLLVVFNSGNNTTDLRGEDLSFTYCDNIFNTGVNKFVFRSKDLESFPLFDF